MKTSLPTAVAVLGILIGLSPWVTGTLYQNYFVGGGLTLLFLSWVIANFQKKESLIQQKIWGKQKKSMIAMTMCLTLGLGMLTYYEMQMPKYNVAMISKELYKVPPQLNKKQLRKLGSECNLEGDTLCAHAVFAKIVRLDSRDYWALANLAMAQSHLGFHENAVANFKIAISNGIQKYDVYKLYGNSLLNTGDKVKAIKAYSASLMRNPQQHNLRKKIKRLTQK